MSAGDKRKRFLAAWNVFRKQDHLITPRTVELFLIIAEHNGIKTSSLGELFPFSQSVFSRHLGKLTGRGYKKGNRMVAGLSLIMTIGDIDDYRSRRAFLTPKGTEVYSQFQQALDGGFTDV
ncbi:MAG: hypothetical protein AB7D39_11790 [Pseudodesulfovibrio sp.]|uniref:hypothetical protein n=1 Tax=Pseudodesulfovibrio sp. TaxID=2035812 RepID=UPI003D1089BD